MTGQVVFSLLLLVASADPAPAGEKQRFEQADGRIAAGAYVEVLDLVGAGPWQDRARAAKTLSRAAELALAQDDAVFASLLCERALAADGRAHDARILRIEVAMKQQRYSEVETLVAGLPPERLGDVRLVRARAAEATGDWGLVEDLLANPSGPEERALLEQARSRRAAAAAESMVDAELQAKLDRAVEEARALDRRAASAEETPAGRARVVAYVTSWCPSCKSLEKYLKEKRIPYEAKDVEKSDAARDEYLKACRDGGIRPGGVPVTTVGRKVIRGFDPAAIERALK